MNEMPYHVWALRISEAIRASAGKGAGPGEVCEHSDLKQLLLQFAEELSMSLKQGPIRCSGTLCSYRCPAFATYSLTGRTKKHHELVFKNILSGSL
jgi:hypothetical protein